MSKVVVFHLKSGQIALGYLLSETKKEFIVGNMMIILPTKTPGETTLVPAGLTTHSDYHIRKDSVLYYYEGDDKIESAFKDSLDRLKAAELGIEVADSSDLKKLEIKQ